MNSLLLIKLRIEGEIYTNDVFNLEFIGFLIDLSTYMVDNFQLIAGIEPIVSDAVGRWSTEQIDLMADLVGGRGKVGVAGLSFKPWHSDPTESPGLALAMCLNAETYDPHIESTCNSLVEIANKCDVLVMAMPFENVEDLHNLDLDGKTVIDWWGMIVDGMGAFKGCKYMRFGKGPERC